MDWMIYGATGYTGRLMAVEALSQGLSPVLAGRSAKVEAMARDLQAQATVCGLEDEPALRRAIRGMRLVLHCAGPFSGTAAPMVSACLAEGVHYLDITGEIAVFAAIHALAGDGRHSDVALVPGVGFDVTPSDCLAATLVQALPAATRLTLAFASAGGPSPGTAKTALEGLAGGGKIMRDGQLRTVPLAWRTRDIPFYDRSRRGVTIPWGDVFTAHVSTGIPDIEVYIAMPPARIKQLRCARFVRPLLSVDSILHWLQRRIERTVAGPDGAQRAAGGMELWGEACSADGRSVSGTMSTPNGYDITVSSALGIVRHLLETDVEGGFYTPSLLMGAGYAQSLPGVTFRMA
jgi:short subunit dehydrogenase-like uncharacterized protein